MDTLAGFGLSDYLGTLRRRWWVVALAVIVTVSIALATSLTASAIYASSARVLIRDPLALSVFDTNQNRISDTTRELETQIELIRSQPVEDAALEALGEDGRFVGRVTARRIGQTDIIEVTARSTRARLAQDAADAWVSAYIDLRKTQVSEAVLSQRDEVQREADSVREQIDEIQEDIDFEVVRLTNEGLSSSAVLTSLQDQLDSVQPGYDALVQKAQELGIEATTRQGAVQKVSDASSPRQVAPDPVRDAGYAVIAGLLLGLCAALVIEHLDESIRTREQIEKLIDLPVLATVPFDPDARGRHEVTVLARPDAAMSESFRSLRTNIRFLSVQQQLHTILVTSATAEDGKSTTAVNLAASMAQDGSRVLLIDADLRRASLHQFFGLSSGPGLTTALVNDGDPSQVIRPIEVPGGSLGLLSAGRLPPNPAELLGSDRFADVLELLAEHADVIIIDVAPVLPVADAAVLSREVDGVLLVAGAKRTGRRQLAGAANALRQVGAPMLGVVLNRTTRDADASYGEIYKQRTAGVQRARKLDEGAPDFTAITRRLATADTDAD